MDNIIKNHVLFWGSICDSLSRVLPSHAIKTWFVPIVPLSYEGGVLSLLVPSQFFLEWIESHYKKNLINSLQKVVKDNRATYKLVVEKKPQTIEFEHIQKTNKKEKPFSPNINNIDDNSFTFLFVGRIIKDKGFFELIEAFKKISVDCPNIKLMILGEIDSKNPSRVNASYIKELSLHPNINIYGHENDVRPFLSKASCFVLPSYREGLSRSILEAMSMELPIITTDVPGCRELVQDKKSGIICKPRSSESLKRAMLKMINLDDDARMRMGKIGRKIVQDGYDESIVIDAMLKVI